MENLEVQDNYNMLILAMKQLEDFSLFFQNNLKKYQNLSDEDIAELIKSDKYTKKEVIEWVDSIENFNFKRTLEHSNELDKRLIISIAAILMGYSKDKIVTKENNRAVIKINEYAFKEFNSHFNFFEQQGQKILFGEIEFSTIEDAFHFLRNKLLHGEYTIENGNIIISKNDKKVKIKYLVLFEYVKNYEDLSNCNNKEYVYKELLGEFQTMHVMTDKGVYSTADFFKNLIVLTKLNFKLKGTRVHNLKTINICKAFIKEFKKINTQKGYVIGINGAYEEALSKYQFILSNHKIVPEYKRIPLSIKTNALESIAKNDNYITNGKKNLDLTEIQGLITVFANKLETSPIFHLQSLVNLIIDSSLQLTLKKTNEDATYINPQTGISLLMFYISVIYPSENILWKGKGTKITDVFNGKVLDFSKLNLNKFSSIGPILNTKTWSSFESQKNEITRNYNLKKTKYETILYNLNEQIKKGNVNQKIIDKLTKLVDSAQKELEEVAIYKTKLDTFDYDKFMENLNIIFHIRNIIAHGNYRIVPIINLNGDIKYNICGDDIYEGVTTYSFDIPIEELYSLSKTIIENMGIIYNDRGLNKIKNEIFKNQLIKATFVDKNKKVEWINLVKACYTNKDYEKLNTLRIAKEFVDELSEPFTISHIPFDQYIEMIGSSLGASLGALSISDIENEQIFSFNNINISSKKYKEILKIILYYLDEESILYQFIHSEEMKHICEENSFIIKMIEEDNKSKAKKG